MRTMIDCEQMTDRELDAAIAEKLWTEAKPEDPDDELEYEGPTEVGPYHLVEDRYGFTSWEVRPFSTDIKAVFEIVEKLLSIEYVKVRLDGSHYHGWTCTIVAPDHTQNPTGISDACVMGESLPRAICLAALKAVK